MFGRLLLLFVFIPIVELYLLIHLGCKSYFQRMYLNLRFSELDRKYHLIMDQIGLY